MVIAERMLDDVLVTPVMKESSQANREPMMFGLGKDELRETTRMEIYTRIWA